MLEHRHDIDVLIREFPLDWFGEERESVKGVG
jgi:hypothetical protein